MKQHDAGLSEQQLLDWIIQAVPRLQKGVFIGIGDDAAAVSSGVGKATLITTDAQVCGVHFLPEHDIEKIGYKAVVVNVSDIAAMGGKPTYCLISLILPKSIQMDAVTKLYKGILTACREYRIAVIGGNITSGKDVSITITMLGTATRKSLIPRTGANVGDKVLACGTFGAAAAFWYLGESNSAVPKEDVAFIKQSFYHPTAWVAVGMALAVTGKVSAMIDCSDGLSTDILRLARASGVGVVLESAAIPKAEALMRVAAVIGKDPDELACNGGEDYALLCSVSAHAVSDVIATVYKKTKNRLCIIGEITDEKKGNWLITPTGTTPLRALGWDHFS